MRAARSAATMVLIAAACANTAVPLRAALPVCGAEELRTTDGAVIGALIYDRSSAEVSLRFPLGMRDVRNSSFRFESDGELELRYGWPVGDFAEDARFVWSRLSENGRDARGTLQFECGNRNMGLLNFPVNFGQPTRGSEDQDIADCIHELDRNGRFSVVIDQRNVPRQLKTGRIALRAARRRAERHIEGELARAEAGLCTIPPQPVPF
jgi:hypothetical protein